MALSADHKDVNEAALRHHNKLRALHQSPRLTIDWVLAKAAQEYADKLARTNSFCHSDAKGKYGENLASSFNSAPGYIFAGDRATQNWYDEIKDYNFNEERQQIGKIGHFSQVVWKGTKTAGFGRAKSSSGNFIIVGQYKPAGNFMGQFKVNVLSPSGVAPKLPVPLKSPPLSKPEPRSQTTSTPKGASVPSVGTPKASPVTRVNIPKAYSVASVSTSKASPVTRFNIPKASPVTNFSIPKASSVTSVCTPRSKDDRMIKKSVKTITENGKKTSVTMETFITTKGQTYELTKTQ